MILWLAEFHDEDGTETVGLFTSEEKAKSEIVLVREAGENFYSYDSVHEIEVDKNRLIDAFPLPEYSQ